MNKRFGGILSFLAIAMLLCSLMTVALSAGVEAASTTLTVSATTGTYNGTANLSARLTSGGSNVSGATISFTLNGGSIGSDDTDGSGIATLTGINVSGIAVGTYTGYIGASFAGDSGNNASSGTATLTVTKANQTISFTTYPPANAVYGTSFNVTAVSTSGLAVNYSSSGTATNSGGAYNKTSGTGTATVTVNQGGNANYSAATPLTANVTAVKNSSSAALISSVNPSKYKQSVTFNATVSGLPGTPTGNVTFMEDSSIMAANVTLSSGGASFITNNFTVASHAITAFYNGDANFNSSTSSALNQTVNKAKTIISMNTSCNLSTNGQLVTFTAVVTSMGTAASGTVTFMDSGTALGDSTLSAGTAELNVSTLAVGNHSITAVYNGDGNFLGSTSEAIVQLVKSNTNWWLIGGLIAAGVVIIIALVVTLVIVSRRRR